MKKSPQKVGLLYHNFRHLRIFPLKFMFSKKATKINEIFTVDLTLCSKRQIDGEGVFNFCGLLSKHELYCSELPNPPKL